MLPNPFYEESITPIHQKQAKSLQGNFKITIFFYKYGYKNHQQNTRKLNVATQKYKYTTTK